MVHPVLAPQMLTEVMLSKYTLGNKGLINSFLLRTWWDKSLDIMYFLPIIYCFDWLGSGG